LLAVSALSSPRLRRIIAGYGINRLGTWIGTIALSLAVYDHTHSALAVASVLVAAQVIPAFAVPALVARVEASQRGRELSALYFFETAATAVLAISLSSFSLPLVLLLVALDGTAALAASALLRTAAARTAREESAEGEDPQAAEQSANAAINVAFSGTFVLGPVMAALLVAGAGAAAALFVDAATFLICGILLIEFRPHVEESGSETVAARLRTAWSHVKRAPALRGLLLAQAVALVFFESAAPIEVAYVKQTLHGGNSGYGYLVGIWGVGVVLGSVVFARAGNNRLGLMVSVGTFMIGCAYIGFAAAPTMVLAGAAAVFGGVGNGLQLGPLISGIQRLTPPALQGRVMGALESIGALSPALGLGLGGLLVALTSPRTAFAIVGAGAALTTWGFARVHVDRIPAAGEAEAAGPATTRAIASAGDRAPGESVEKPGQPSEVSPSAPGPEVGVHDA
jgi:MFS family permease